MRSIKQRLTYQSFFEELESRVVLSTLATGEVAWVMTDKSDYHPGTMAMISAGGFKIGERIDLRVANLTNGHIYPAFSATDGSAGDLDGKADGHIQTSWYVNWDCANSALHMTATGETSGATADYDFTDSATITSTATGGNWNSTTTWVGGVVPVSGDSVIIATTGANTVTVNGGGSITVGNMTVNSGATLDLNGKNLTIGGLSGAGSVTNNGNSASTLTINGSTSQTFSGVISNGSRTLSLIMAGTGTQTLSGTNTYTGVTTLNVGVLSVATIGNGGTAGNLGKATTAASNLVLGGGTLQYTGSTASTNRGFTLSAGTTSTIEITTATTNLTFSGASASTSGGLIKSGAGTLTLAAVNAYTGSTTVNAGTLSISADNNLGTAPGSATPGKLTLNGGTLATTATFTLNANRGISLGASGGTIDAASGATLTYNGIAAGTGSLTKTNTGILSLGGANTYSGDTIVSAGTLRLGINNALPGGTGKGNVVVNGTLDLNTFSSTINGLSGSGTIDTAAGGAPTLTIGGNNASGTTFSGVIKDTTGTLAVTKVGTGTLTLSGINTYKGTTTINAGTLEVDGSQTNSSVTVNSGGTLSGTGTVGAITASGGTVIPGTSSGIGILTASSANFSAGGTLLIQVNGLTTAGTNYARLNLTGTSTLGGTSKLTFNLSGLAADGTASGIVIYGSRSGAFNTVTVINSGYLAAANYNATSLDGVFDGPLTAGSFTPPTATEGQPFSNVVVFHFTDADPAAVAANFSALITWGDGTASTVTSSASANGQIVASGNGFDVQASHVYAEELSNVTFSVAVTDIGTSGHLATASASTSAFSVADQQLTNLASGNLPASGQENVAVPAITGIATFTDPAGAEPVGDYTATIRWGDTTTSTGTVVLVSGNNFRVDAPAHLYAEEGTYTVNVTLTHDALPAVTTPNQSITINDQQLTSLASGNLPASGQEGAPLPAITGIATFTDPAGAEPVGDYTATIHWGDTTTSTGTIVATGGGNFRVDAPAHTYVEEGSYTVNVTLTHDALPAVTTPNQTISIGDVAPTVAADKASVTAVEGTTVSNTGTFADIDDAVTITASRGTVTQDNSHDTWSWSGAAADDNAYDVTVTATNADGSTAAAIFHVSFTDASPVVTAALATVTAPENTAATNSGTYGDFDDPVSVSGPGVTDHHDGTWTWSGTGDEDQPYNVTVTATNVNGLTSSTTFHVSFTDVPPTLVSLAHASVTTTTTVPVTNSGAFTDYDDAMTITASQGTLTDHGDGTWTWTQTGQVSDSGTVLVTVRNSDNHSASTTFSVIFNPAVSITTTSLADWTINQPGYNQTISASGGTGTLTFSSTGTLPTGLTLSTSGVLSGTPTAAGNYSFTVTATDTVGASGSQNYAVTINPAVTITTTTLPNWTMNQPGYSQTIDGSAGTGACTFSSTGTLPTGLTLSSNGVLSGTPTAAGSCNFTVTATDTVGASGSQSYTVTINPTVNITTSTLANWTVNQPGYNQTISATGGTGALTFSSSGTLPAGLTLSSSGVLSGTPTAAGNYSFTVTATDTVGASSSQSYAVTINPAVSITTTTLPSGTLNQPGYSQTIMAAGGTGITTFALTSGTLPTGLTLSTGGVLSGTPSFAAIYAFTVTAMDSLGASVSQSYSLPIVGLNDPGFENPAVGNGGIRYNPSSSPWSFHGSAGLAGNGSPFTVGNPVAPQGSQVAFIQALSSVSQNMVLPAGTFTLSFGAAQRGNVQAGGQTLQVLIDGTVIATFNNLTSTSYTNQVSSSFTVKAGSHALVFQGTDLHGGDNTMFVDQVAVNALPAGLADSGFESIVVGNGSSQYNPTGSPWTFQGGAGVTGNGSPFTAGNPNAPQGSQVAFIQALGGISQVVACPAGTYVITFDAAQRGNVQAGGQTFQVLIDGNVIGSFTNLTGTAYTSQATSSFTVSAGNHTLLIRGTDLHGGDNTILVDQFAITSQATNLNDSGFETPVVANGSFQVNPAGSPWTFQGSAGLTGNGSLLTNGNPNAPQGSQVAFVQALGSISQSVTFAAGTYSLSFLAAQRANVQAGGQTFQILVDGTVVGIFNNLVATSYTALSSASFTVTAGSHTLTIQGTDLKGGDNTVLVDQFLINPLG